MAYTKFNDPWGYGDCCGTPGVGQPNTPIRAAALNHIEQGIFDAFAAADAAMAAATAAQTTANNAVPQSNVANQVYVNDGSGDPTNTIVLAISPDPFTIPLRDASGRMQAANPVANADVVNLQTARGIANNYNFALTRQPADIWQGTITRDANGAAISANVTWPDGTPGVYTGTPSVSFPGSCDSWTITYGIPTQITYTQPPVTRDGVGNITVQPMITAT